jgi:glutamate-1-semialdehyde 2,1-aminomutase
MTTLGKIVGGGLPLGAYGGRAEIMDSVAPVGPVYQAGTLSGNPVAVTAGLAMLSLLEEGGSALYKQLDALGETVATGLRESARNANVPVLVNQLGSMITVFFTEASSITDYAAAKTSDTVRFGKWFRALLEAGVYWPPSQFEAAFLPAIWKEQEVELLLTAAEKAFATV